MKLQDEGFGAESRVCALDSKIWIEERLVFLLFGLQTHVLFFVFFNLCKRFVAEQLLAWVQSVFTKLNLSVKF